MRRMMLAAALSLAPLAANAQPAQQPQLQAQLDAAQAQVARIMVGLTTTIAQDQATITHLQAEIARMKEAGEPGTAAPPHPAAAAPGNPPRSDHADKDTP